MNDDELGRSLRDEFHRMRLPDAAPEAVHAHLRDLRSMAPVRPEAARPTRLLRDLAGIAAAVAICALVAAGLLFRASSPSETGAGPEGGYVEMFGRIDARTAWAESGSDLWITRDGGDTWSKGTLPGGKSPGQLYGDASASEGAPVGQAGETPGPTLTATWHYYPVFIDAEHGWLLSWTPSNATPAGADYSMTVWRTSDGGRTWSSTALEGTYRGIGFIQFIDSRHGWITIPRTDLAGIAGDYPADATTVLATADGGATWKRVSTLAVYGLALWISPTEAWGYGATRSSSGMDVVVHTTDAGATWQTAKLPLPGDGSVSGWPARPVLVDGRLVIRLLYAGSSGYEILSYRSDDNGRNWSQAAASPADFTGNSGQTRDAPLLNLSLDQPIVGSVGSDPTEPTGFKATFDGGATWETYTTGGLPSSYVSTAEWTAPGDVWVMVAPSTSGAYARGRLYRTDDGGLTWQPLLGAPSWPVSPRLETPVPPETPVVDTPQPTDGPTPESSGAFSGTLIDSVGRAGAGTGWVVTGDGLLLLRITDDGGATWSDPGPLPNAEKLQFVDAQHGWIASVAAAGGYFDITVNRTVDGGASWQAHTIATRATVGDQVMYTTATVHFRDALHGELFFASGPSGPPDPAVPTPPAGVWTCGRYSTADGGATWSDAVAGPCLGDVTFEDAGFGYAADARMVPTLYVTADGGQSWTTGSLPADSTVTSTAAVHVVVRRSDGKLRAIGDWAPGSSAALVVESGDGGLTWKSLGVAQGRPEILDQVVALSDNHWLAIGASPNGAFAGESLYSSEDGGLTWQKVVVGDTTAQPFGMAFASETDGWIVMTSVVCDGPDTPKSTACQPGSSSLYATMDGGATWRPFFTP